MCYEALASVRLRLAKVLWPAVALTSAGSDAMLIAAKPMTCWSTRRAVRAAAGDADPSHNQPLDARQFRNAKDEADLVCPNRGRAVRKLQSLGWSDGGPSCCRNSSQQDVIIIDEHGHAIRRTRSYLMARDSGAVIQK
jgi:hypothetical protein